ncbi:MAG: aspartate 1-decarboxylase [Oscillospiraceae bacterium]|nr:aspartate 1-decarboxylase [Oscillospiraceae bacterium]
MIEVLMSKIHRATVTEADLNYVGSITISKEMTDKAGIFEYQKVTVANVNSGNRFDTYVIVTEEPGVICLNGATARLCCVGDLLIIMAYETIDKKNAKDHKPVVVHVDAENQVLSECR